MNDIITARDIDIVTAEIKTIQRQAQKTMLLAAIEIGRRLVEAKKLLNHGEWGKWLEEKVDYSQSTANNLMRIYTEYGESDQRSLFDSPGKSQTFANLSYTQALALLAIPAEERAEFAEENHVEDMSTRELQEAIRERDEAKKESQKYFDELEDTRDELWSANQRASGFQEDAKEAKARADEAAHKVRVAEKAQQDALAQVSKLQEKLDSAKAAEKKAKDQLREVKENPVVSDDLMEKLRQEAEEAAAKKIADASDKKTEALQKQLDEAKASAASAEAALAEAQKKAKMASPEVAVFQSMFNSLADNINKINGHRLKTMNTNQSAAEGMRKALSALLQQALEGLNREAEGM